VARRRWTRHHDAVAPARAHHRLEARAGRSRPETAGPLLRHARGRAGGVRHRRPGPALLVPAAWLSHLELAWQDPVVRAFYAPLAAHRTVVRYDKPGCGLSDPWPGRQTLDTDLEVLRAVADQLRLDRFDLLGISMAAPVSVAFAARHPDRVGRLVLHRRDDRAMPYRLGRDLAARIPGARLVSLAGRSQLPYAGDATAVVHAILAFLDPAAGRPRPAPPARPAGTLTARQLQAPGRRAGRRGADQPADRRAAGDPGALRRGAPGADPPAAGGQLPRPGRRLVGPGRRGD
jgi:pimeloyl-ACP methyl ester carboxylesterase